MTDFPAPKIDFAFSAPKWPVLPVPHRCAAFWMGVAALVAVSGAIGWATAPKESQEDFCAQSVNYAHVKCWKGAGRQP